MILLWRTTSKRITCAAWLRGLSMGYATALIHQQTCAIRQTRRRKGWYSRFGQCTLPHHEVACSKGATEIMARSQGIALITPKTVNLVQRMFGASFLRATRSKRHNLSFTGNVPQRQGVPKLWLTPLWEIGRD